MKPCPHRADTQEHVNHLNHRRMRSAMSLAAALMRALGRLRRRRPMARARPPWRRFQRMGALRGCAWRLARSDGRPNGCAATAWPITSGELCDRRPDRPHRVCPSRVMIDAAAFYPAWRRHCGGCTCPNLGSRNHPNVTANPPRLRFLILCGKGVTGGPSGKALRSSSANGVDAEPPPHYRRGAGHLQSCRNLHRAYRHLPEQVRAG